VAFDGQSYTDLATIARTVGLTNPATRQHRCQVAVAYVDLALALGSPALAAHIGFIPEDRNQRDYQDLVQAVREVLDGYARHELALHLETGQESAHVLLQFLHDVDRPNLGVNFDPANFLLYGTDQALPALERLAPWVRGVHCKHGLGAEHPGQLGK